MTDNYRILYQYMSDLGLPNTFDEAEKSDLFFDIQLIRRGKDHPDLPSANYTFKTYYIKCLEHFKRRYDEIVKCCDMFKLRAYISVNAKSKQEATKKACERYAHNIVTNDYRSPWKAFSSVCGGLDGEEKRWVVDVDNCTIYSGVIKEISELINSCKSKFNLNVICFIPTKSGVHIITHPFNIQEFSTLCQNNNIDIPDIKKNHLTLLYENIDE